MLLATGMIGLAACDSISAGPSDQAATTQIMAVFAQDPCAKYFHAESANVLDKKVSDKTATVDAVVLISRTDAFTKMVNPSPNFQGFDQFMHQVMDDCRTQFSIGRLSPLTTAFQSSPMAPVTWRRAFQFEKWDSGWRIVGGL